MESPNFVTTRLQENWSRELSRKQKILRFGSVEQDGSVPLKLSPDFRKVQYDDAANTKLHVQPCLMLSVYQNAGCVSWQGNVLQGVLLLELSRYELKKALIHVEDEMTHLVNDEISDVMFTFR